MGTIKLSALCLTALLLSACARDAVPDSRAAALIGSSAPEWTLSHWVGSQPLSLAQLRGRPVLIRWWAAPGCALCSASVARLQSLHRRYGAQGLFVLGLYHDKTGTPPDRRRLGRMASELGIGFPVALDPEWGTLKRYWLDRVPGSDYTSVSFLLDSEGIVRYVHPGGEISGEDERALRQVIEELL